MRKLISETCGGSDMGAALQVTPRPPETDAAIDHLYQALEMTERDDQRFHIREALQLLIVASGGSDC